MTTDLFAAPRCAIELHPQGCSVLSPYNPAFVAALKSSVPTSARVWDKEAKRWLIDVSYAPIVADLIEQFYGEQVTVPAPMFAAAQASEQVEIKVEYLGTSKDRGDDSRSAFGFYNGGWNVVFPEAVLRAFFKDSDSGTGLQATYYEALGLDRGANAQEVKAGYRRRARQWHPDVCHEPDAEEQFKRVRVAYELLSDPLRKKKYDAGLKFEESLHLQRGRRRQFADNGYRAPLRSGLLLVSAHQQLGRLIVDEIHAWNDIVDDMGRVHVASWPRGGDHFQVTWVGSIPEDDLDVPF